MIYGTGNHENARVTTDSESRRHFPFISDFYSNFCKHVPHIHTQIVPVNTGNEHALAKPSRLGLMLARMCSPWRQLVGSLWNWKASGKRLQISTIANIAALNNKAPPSNVSVSMLFFFVQLFLCDFNVVTGNWDFCMIFNTICSYFIVYMNAACIMCDVARRNGGGALIVYDGNFE